MKGIFRDESPSCIDQGYDAGTCVLCFTNEKYKEDCMKKTIQYSHSFIICGVIMEMTITTIAVNAHRNFGHLVSKIENTFVVINLG